MEAIDTYQKVDAESDQSGQSEIRVKGPREVEKDGISGNEKGGQQADWSVIYPSAYAIDGKKENDYI